MMMTEHMKIAQERHDHWAKTEQARRDFRAAYDHLHDSDHKMLVNLIFEFAADLGYELKPRNPYNDNR